MIRRVGASLPSRYLLLGLALPALLTACVLASGPSPARAQDDFADDPALEAPGDDLDPEFVDADPDPVAIDPGGRGRRPSTVVATEASRLEARLRDR